MQDIFDPLDDDDGVEAHLSTLKIELLRDGECMEAPASVLVLMLPNLCLAQP